MPDPVPTERIFRAEGWENHVDIGTFPDFFKDLEDKAGMIPPEMNFGNVTPTTYVDSLRLYVISRRPDFGINKLEDMYTLRRVVLGLKDAREQSKRGNMPSDFGQLDQAIQTCFQVAFEEYDQSYQSDFKKPKLIASIFGPVAKALPEGSIRKVVNTYVGNKVDNEAIVENILKNN